jgi:hypothetical protein
MQRLEWFRKARSLLPTEDDVAGNDDIEIERFCDTEPDPYEPRCNFAPEADSGIMPLDKIFRVDY